MKIETNLKFYRTSSGKSSFRTQNDTDKANFPYTANKKYRSYFKARASRDKGRGSSCRLDPRRDSFLR